jgi:hypothetical protein
MITFQPGTSSPAPSEDDLARLERDYRITLPASYRALVREHGNGGVPIENRLLHGGRERLVERVLCVLSDPNTDGENGWYDVSVVTSQLDDRLAEGPDQKGTAILPIAALFAGDFVCLDYRGGRREPAVAIWDHDRSVTFKPHLDVVAESFDAFLAMLGRG